jgi:microcystin degradation protein MlrC
MSAEPLTIFIAGVMHETHSFCQLSATLDRFKATGGYLRDGEIPRVLRGTRTEMGAIFDLADRYHWRLIHPLFASTTPSGPVTEEAFEHFSEVILTSLKQAESIDGVLLVLHGAMVTDHVEDAEAELLRRVRGIVGQGKPIAVTLDPHANIGPGLAMYADIVSTYRTTPHVDQYETALRAGELLQRAVRGEINPKVSYAQRPMFYGLDQGRTISGHGPMVDILAKAKSILDNEPDILEISINAGFDWSDKKNVGCSVLVTGNGSTSRAQLIANELIDFAWETRSVKTIELLPLDDVIRIARESPQGPGPLLIGDYTDCPAGGGMGDGTTLLKAMIDGGLEGAVMGAITDPESVRMAMNAGPGTDVEFNLGGKLDPRFGGGPLQVMGRVLVVSDGVAIRKGPFATGVKASFGPSCLIEIAGVKVIVATHRVQIDDREQFRIYGIDPEHVNVLACKAMNHFRADFEKIGRRLIYAESGGLVSTNWSQFPYQKVRRPIWPLDPYATCDVPYEAPGQQDDRRDRS